ncbi:DUF5954 family protein [Streptomyces sp. ACA25]|uniref:DUF5954 family protein n=1 Tax=Streptomyces sp. ACA25 TaxID=3022596 RepID=UPI002307A181|nr:DUF5954 family protein [Streptomyces sp. ACA25]MDB1088548.1 DUF5954 family protein [Streptomyces sp. ACA25]
MSDDNEQHPVSHPGVRGQRSEGPGSAAAEAWEVRAAYPEVRGYGPMFALVGKEPAGRWRVWSAEGETPQACREELARQCRLRAQRGAYAGERAAQLQWLAGADRAEAEVLSELFVEGCRFRVARGDLLLRMGPDGPEPPRSGDPDPDPVLGACGGAVPVSSRTVGFLLDPAAGKGSSAGILLADLLSFIPPVSVAPPEVRAEARLALHTHPGGVLLPPLFVAAEEVDGGGWTPITGGSEEPQGSRNSLATHLRLGVRRTQELSGNAVALLAQAADLLARERRNEISVLGRRYRVMRVERLLRVGPDGPESPRPSEAEPELPAGVQG